MCHSPFSLKLFRPVTPLWSLPVVAGVLLAVSCQFSVAPRNLSNDNRTFANEIDADTQQVRLRMRALVDPMSGEIESAADEIIAATDDPAVRRAALKWKAEAVPALREALFEPDPLTALVDTWALANQMIFYFSHGPGTKALGEGSAVAASASLRLERQMNEVASEIITPESAVKARAGIRRWAEAHPIETSIAHREPALSEVLDQELGPELSAGESLGTLTMTMDDLNRRLEVYTDQLLRQVRWEAELLTMDLTEQLELDEAVPLATQAIASVDEMNASVAQVRNSVDVTAGTIENLLPVIERLVLMVESMPELVARERTAATEAVQGELTRVIESVQQEREVALQHVTAERLAALNSLHEALIQERQVLTKDIEAASIEAVDHAFWRAVQLTTAVVAVLLVALSAAFVMIRKTIGTILRQQAELIRPRQVHS